MLLLLGARLLPDLSAGAEFKLILDLGLGVIHLFGLVVAIFLGTSLLYKEIEKRTIYLLIAKPLDPAEFILGKHLGLAAVLAVLIALMSLCFAAVLAIGRVPAGGLAAALGLSVAFGYLELLVIVAAALFFGSFTSPVLASIFTISLYLVGHFTADLLNLGRLSKNAFSAQLTQFLYLILPNLERLNLRNGAVYGQLPPPGELALSGLYALLYTGLLLSLAVLIFARREF